MRRGSRPARPPARRTLIGTGQTGTTLTDPDSPESTAPADATTPAAPAGATAPAAPAAPAGATAPAAPAAPAGATAPADPTLEEFRDASRAFLEANATRRPPANRHSWGSGSDWDVAIWEEFDPEQGPAELARARAWRAKRFDAGFGWISGPPAYGGRGLPSAYERTYAGLEAGYDVPAQVFFKLAPVVAPILVDHGGEALARRYAPGLARGDEIACELFSEPDAGSDLASLRCRAEWVGEAWVINGEKVWTSDADIATIGLILARTAPSGDRTTDPTSEPTAGGPRDRTGNRGGNRTGLTTFIIDMSSPGVVVRPLRQMTGGAAFNQVMLTDVVVPDTQRIGSAGGGWTVARATLALERALVGAGHGRGGVGVADGSRLIELARHLGVERDPLIRQELVAAYSGFRVTAMLNRRMAAAGRDGTERVAAKLALGANTRRVSHLLGRLLGPRLVADSGEWGTYAWSTFVLGEPGVHIAVGTDETIRNLVAERILGLPRGP